MVFWRFQGVWKCDIELKWVKDELFCEVDFLNIDKHESFLKVNAASSDGHG